MQLTCAKQRGQPQIAQQPSKTFPMLHLPCRSFICSMHCKPSGRLQSLSVTLLIYDHKSFCQFLDGFNEADLVFLFSRHPELQIKIYGHVYINRTEHVCHQRGKKNILVHKSTGKALTVLLSTASRSCHS